MVDLEGLYHSKSSLTSVFDNKSCPKCNTSLKENLVPYPEHIFYNDALLNNTERIEPECPDDTEILEVYLLE